MNEQLKILVDSLEHFKEVAESHNGFEKSVAMNALNELKLLLTKYKYLSENASKLPKFDRMVFREILELGIIVAVRLKDYEELTSLFSQLKFFYFENPDLPRSQRMYTLIDIHLLMSIAQDDRTTFVTDIAQVMRTFESNFYIQYVLDIERALSDNSFIHLHELVLASPSILFKPFLDKLLEKVRISLSKNICSQCPNLKVKDMTKILHFRKDDETREFFNEILKWEVDANGSIEFQKKKDSHPDAPSSTTMEVILASANKFNSLL